MPRSPRPRGPGFPSDCDHRAEAGFRRYCPVNLPEPRGRGEASSPGFGGEPPTWAVSRVLFRSAVTPAPARIIHLGDALPRRSSALTRTLHTAEAARLGGRPQQCPYSSLLREGLASPPVTRLSRVGSYPTISPLPVRATKTLQAIGGVISVALSLGSPRVAVSDLPALWSPDFPPADGGCPPAILHPPPAPERLVGRALSGQAPGKAPEKHPRKRSARAGTGKPGCA